MTGRRAIVDIDAQMNCLTLIDHQTGCSTAQQSTAQRPRPNNTWTHQEAGEEEDDQRAVDLIHLLGAQCVAHGSDAESKDSVRRKERQVGGV